MPNWIWTWIRIPMWSRRKRSLTAKLVGVRRIWTPPTKHPDRGAPVVVVAASVPSVIPVMTIGTREIPHHELADDAMRLTKTTVLPGKIIRLVAAAVDATGTMKRPANPVARDAAARVFGQPIATANFGATANLDAMANFGATANSSGTGIPGAARDADVDAAGNAKKSMKKPPTNWSIAAATMSMILIAKPHHADAPEPLATIPMTTTHRAAVDADAGADEAAVGPTNATMMTSHEVAEAAAVHASVMKMRWRSAIHSMTI